MPHTSPSFVRRACVTAVLAVVSALPGAQPAASAQSAATASAGLHIGALHLQGSTRVSLYQYDYTYTADLANTASTAINNVTGTVSSSSPSTLITQGQVGFGTVGAGATVTSSATFTIRQDRRYPFNPSSLAWSFSGTPTLPAGTVSPTANPQVAQYTVNLPAPGTVTVNFGTTTAYGHHTAQVTAAAVGPVSIPVAGMLPNTPYHLQAALQFSGGGTVLDIDHTFTSGAPELSIPVSAATTAGLTPQPGLELLTVASAPNGLIATDLAGNIVWSYAVPPADQAQIQGAQLLPNGHFLVTIGQDSATVLRGGPPAGATQSIREFDLAGTTVRELTLASLNSRLQAAGYNLTLTQFHHDLLQLPNGHILALSNVVKAFTNLPGYPGTTNVLADVVVDLDPSFNPVWVWNEFDHLDVNRHPMAFPDLTHTNAVVYSPTDHNLIISMRHQNWILKIDYRDGQGSGGILWHLGYQGDFQLINGTDPTDFQFAQHYPSLFSANSAGVFRLGVMDNGDDRVFPGGVTCGDPGAPACYYTSIPVYQIDENALTATLVFHQILPTNLYSFFGGNTDQLPNGNVEYALSASIAPQGSDIFEVTPDPANPQTVWHLRSPSEYLYRGYRIASLYPGVQY